LFARGDAKSKAKLVLVVYTLPAMLMFAGAVINYVR
jgi:hypothetical protein